MRYSDDTRYYKGGTDKEIKKSKLQKSLKLLVPIERLAFDG